LRGPVFIFGAVHLNSRTEAAVDTSSSLPATPAPDAPSEPLLTVGGVTALGTAVVAVAVAFGLHLSDAQTGAILTVLAVAAPFIVALVGRSRVFAPDTVRAMILAAARTGRMPR
jgi:hypothetical protein